MVQLQARWAPTHVPDTMVRGIEGRWLARRMLGALNDSAGSPAELAGAIQRLEGGSVLPWLKRMAEQAEVRHGAFAHQQMRYNGYAASSFRMAALPAADRLAIEMWLSEADEARAFSGELALIARQWKEADRLGAISDGLEMSEHNDSGFIERKSDTQAG